ncbi:SSD1 [Candida margitis]|uniref:SSD1 n=1 Tax=Candida margitis TaxID=1775924 RepID=UPI0022263C6E|nr:SSD1 [Candida margitis]KAI5968974.1 SSD1 [Candida margitis]
MSSSQNNSDDLPTRVSSRKGKNLHVAHRRSPSELTTLMVEQYNLQRQLDQVQAQQRQILEQQQQQQQQQYLQPQFEYPPSSSSSHSDFSHSSQQSNHHHHHNNNRGSHSRSSSINNNNNNTHRRTGSASGTAHGHTRRHSLALNEAIAAADQQRTSRLNSSPSHAASDGADDTKVGSFRFPPESNDPSSPSNAAHNRSRSSAYGSQTFKFPATPSQEGSSGNNNLLPPTPNFSITQSPERGGGGSHNRKPSHYRTASRNSEGINQNWRQQNIHLTPQSGSHHRQSSGLEPPPGFVPGHRPRNSSYGGGNSVSSISQFLPNSGAGGQGGGQGGQNTGNGRKSLFAPYLPQSSLPELINEGRLVTGILRVNKKNRSDAYVSTDGLLDADIFICGSKDRNRALEGDLVAVELLVVDEVWESKKEKEEKKRRKDHNTRPLNDDIHNDATSAPTTTGAGSATESKDEKSEEGSLGRRGSLKQRPTMKKNDDVEVEGQSLLLVEEEEINDEVKPLYAGHVVAVVDRIPGQLFAGTLGLLRPAQAAQAARDKKSGNEPSVHTPKAPKIVWFKPTDKKVPLIAIPTEQAPADFVSNHEKYADQLFVASIKRWPITSLHPFGTLVSKLGKIDSPDIEVDSILRDNNFLCDEYPNDKLDDEEILGTFDLPSVESELENSSRTEYLNDYIIAFSPNGQFVDHALHVKRLSNTKIELGFHVSDVSYFVKPGSVLDRKSKKRSSSVFLPQKVVHLYPQQVNKLISFKENVKNLALSVVFEIDTTNFEVEDLFIHESVIVPKQIVNYDFFDKILENKPVDTISSATSDYIRTFSLIAKEFRRQRLANRSLGITPNLTLLDQLDDEKVALSLNIFDDSLARDVVSEIALKVNSAIAAKVQVGLGNKAFLRRQGLPTLQKIETFVRKATNLGFKIDTTDAATLQNSLLKIEDPVKRQCVEILLYKCMARGKYYVAGKQDPDSYGHYYYNLPLYTHFTAPLRRYADLIVHRQLKAVLHKEEEEKDVDSLKALADYCNFKKDCAASAQEQAIHLLLSQTINELSESAGQLLCMGTVIQVYESSFDVFIPEFGIEKRVHGDQLPLAKAEFDKTNRVLELFWEKGVDSATYIPPDEATSLSYRNSIKNKYRTSSAQAAKIQNRAILEKKESGEDSIVEKLQKMNLEPPKLTMPPLKRVHEVSDEDATKSMPNSPTQSHMPQNLRTNSSSLIDESEGSNIAGLAPYLQSLETKVEGDSYTQVIRELSEVPVLLRAEIGMTLPCLTVRILNPFT